MTLGRRQLLQALAATGATALVARPGFARAAASAPARRRRRLEPEPLQVFPALAEGFHRSGRDVYYIDEQHRAWAPPGLSGSQLTPIDPLAEADLHSILQRLRKRHWPWTIEHAVLRRLATDRPLAEALLAAALDIDRARPAPSNRRLHALAAALAAPRRIIWRSAGTDGRAFATRLAAV